MRDRRGLFMEDKTKLFFFYGDITESATMIPNVCQKYIKCVTNAVNTERVIRHTYHKSGNTLHSRTI